MKEEASLEYGNVQVPQTCKVLDEKQILHDTSAFNDSEDNIVDTDTESENLNLMAQSSSEVSHEGAPDTSQNFQQYKNMLTCNNKVNIDHKNPKKKGGQEVQEQNES